MPDWIPAGDLPWNWWVGPPGPGNPTPPNWPTWQTSGNEPGPGGGTCVWQDVANVADSDDAYCTCSMAVAPGDETCKALVVNWDYGFIPPSRIIGFELWLEYYEAVVGGGKSEIHWLHLTENQAPIGDNQAATPHPVPDTETAEYLSGAGLWGTDFYTQAHVVGRLMGIGIAVRMDAPIANSTIVKIDLMSPAVHWWASPRNHGQLRRSPGSEFFQP